MLYATYRVQDGQFLMVGRAAPTYDQVTEAVARYPEHLWPDARTERYDAASPTKKRAATVQEIADYDVARANDVVVAQFDGPTQKMVKALAIWSAQKHGIPPATARAEILAIFKGL